MFVDMENYNSEERGGERLRYSSIQSVLQGLWIFMYLGRQEVETVFHVEDGGHRLIVGFGKVYALKRLM